MLGCACRREHLKRRSMARCLRASSSISASHSRVAPALRFLAAASVRVVSTWRLMVERLSWFSFSSRGVIGILSGIEDESVVIQQRQRVGDQIVQQRIAQAKRRLRLARGLLLAQDIGDVVGAESTGGGSFLDGLGYRLGAVLADQLQQLGKLPR